MLKAGLTLPQVMLCAALSCTIVMLYAVPAALLGAKSGWAQALKTAPSVDTRSALQKP
jgi:hypothetical protein